MILLAHVSGPDAFSSFLDLFLSPSSFIFCWANIFLQEKKMRMREESLESRVFSVSWYTWLCMMIEWHPIETMLILIIFIVIAIVSLPLPSSSSSCIRHRHHSWHLFCLSIFFLFLPWNSFIACCCHTLLFLCNNDDDGMVIRSIASGMKGLRRRKEIRIQGMKRRSVSFLSSLFPSSALKIDHRFHYFFFFSVSFVEFFLYSYSKSLFGWFLPKVILAVLFSSSSPPSPPSRFNLSSSQSDLLRLEVKKSVWGNSKFFHSLSSFFVVSLVPPNVLRVSCEFFIFFPLNQEGKPGTIECLRLI